MATLTQKQKKVRDRIAAAAALLVAFGVAAAVRPKKR